MTSQFLEIELFKSWEEFLPIDAMGIKLRAIHTGVFSEELVFLMDGDHAAPHIPVASIITELRLAIVFTP